MNSGPNAAAASVSSLLRGRMFIELNESLLVGYELIDQDHKLLATLVNEFYETVTNGANKYKVYDAIDHLSNEFSQHFSRENSLMTQSRYPDKESHAEEHRRLMGDLGRFLQMVDESTDDDLKNVAQFIESWFVLHVRRSDRKLGKFLSGRAAGA